MKAHDMMQKIIKELRELDVDQINDYVDLSATTMVSLMRGMRGDEYAEKFLKNSLNDENPLYLTPPLHSLQ